MMPNILSVIWIFIPKGLRPPARGCRRQTTTLGIDESDIEPQSGSAQCVE